MPRAGGEADKLGNRYESTWTVHLILDILSGASTAITVEPFGQDAIGIELVQVLNDGTREYHSLKRQKAGSGWSLSELCKPSAAGRSILGDLLSKQQNDPGAKA